MDDMIDGLRQEVKCYPGNQDRRQTASLAALRQELVSKQGDSCGVSHSDCTRGPC